MSISSEIMELDTSGSEYVFHENTQSVDRELSQEPTNKKSKSDGKKKITDYFTVEQDPKSSRKIDKQGKCTLCTTVLKMKNCGTSALKRHLQSRHTKIYEQVFGKVEHSTSHASSSESTNANKESTILSWLSSSGNNTNERDFQQEKFHKLLVEYMVKKYLPFNFFEDEISLQVYRYLNPKVILPGRNKMNSLAMKMFGSAQDSLKSLLNKNKSKISFTIDGWSSFSMKGYYGITAHFIDDNWRLHAILLDFVSAQGQHTGRWIAKLFADTLEFYDLTNSVQGITTDNTNSNFTFMNELTNLISDIDPKNSHFVCFAHILNLGARDFIKILDWNSEFQATDDTLSDVDSGEISEDVNSLSPINKIHCLGKKLKNSENLRKDFEKFCITMNLTMALPKLDVITRWNSTLDMLRWGLNMKKSLNILCDNTENMKTLKPTDTEWSMIDRVCKYLNSFKTLSKTLEGEAYCTLPMVIIGINMLLDKLEKWAIELDNNPSRDETDEKFIYGIQAAKDKIIKHYQRTNWMYCVVLILDPRHKVETFSNTSWGKDLEKEAVRLFEKIFETKYFQPGLQSTTASSLPSSSKDECSEFDIDLLSLFKKSPISRAKELAWRYEIDKFLSEPRADSSEDILDWWKRHENVFPNLAKMAKDFLSTPASSAPVERQFSRAALTVTKTRNRLGDNSIRCLMCLRSWMENEVVKQCLENSQY